MPLIVTPGFSFNGDCAEAIRLYQRAFGAEVTVLLHYADANPADWDRPMDERERNMVYHAEMMVGGQRVMLSDEIEGGIQPGNALGLVVTFEDKESVQRAYAVLAEEGTPVIPPRATTYSSCIGRVRDKFGFTWGLMTEQTEG
ncbi:MAG: VOC family protein [Anaerolineae bacterium]|nr:VOC family protein [Anaerolineae bacterium]